MPVGSKVVLVGHSIGGMTIQTLARDDPAFFNAHVAGIVLVNTTYTNPLKTMILSGLCSGDPLAGAGAADAARRSAAAAGLAERLAELSQRLGAYGQPIGFGRYVTRSQLEHTTLLSTRNPPGKIQPRATWRCSAGTQQARWLRNYLAAAGAMPGKMDIVTKPEAGQAIAGDHPGATFSSVEGANHMGFLERPDVYRECRNCDLRFRGSCPIFGVPNADYWFDARRTVAAS